VSTAAAADEMDSWLSLPVAWVAGAAGAGVVVVLAVIVCVIVISRRRLKRSRR